MNGSPELSPAFQLVGALQAVHDRLEGALEPVGLSLAKFGVLARLVAAGEPLPLGTLAERCACVRSNITQLVDRLEADKLVLRAPDPRDRRSTRAELTAEGRRLYEEGRCALEATEQKLFAGLLEHEQEELVRLLKSLRRVP
ncbi:MAG TPA: MarR family transcriptional regulator [Vicinamibacteria bacterium]|nr:MarR family transcriptional regulator [Vicinamibacteria bacterium]